MIFELDDISYWPIASGYYCSMLTIILAFYALNFLKNNISDIKNKPIKKFLMNFIKALTLI